MNVAPESPEALPPRARLICGIGCLLVLNIGLPFLGVPLVATTDLSVKAKTLAGGVFIAIGELALPVSIAILGKPGFAYVKSLVLRRLRSLAPPGRVSRLRYQIGLALFAIPVLFGVLDPYAGRWIGVTDENRITCALAADALLITSVFVLGGEFWDKLRALFVHDATACFSGGPPDEE